MFLKPDYNVEKLEDIDFEALAKDGKSVLMFDLDSTVMPSHSGEFLPQTRELLLKLSEKFAVVIVTNNKDEKYLEKVRAVSDFEVIADAGKPSIKKIYEYLAKIGKTPQDAVMIGDRPLTDVLAGFLAGTTTILVDSITKDKESPVVRFVRKLERLVIAK